MIKSFNINFYEPICLCNIDALIMSIIQEDKVFKFNIKCALCGINISFPVGGFAYDFSFDSAKPLRTFHSENRIFALKDNETINVKRAKEIRKDIKIARVLFFTLLFLIPVFVYIKSNLTFVLFLVSLFVMFLSHAFIGDAKRELKCYE